MTKSKLSSLPPASSSSSLELSSITVQQRIIIQRILSPDSNPIVSAFLPASTLQTLLSTPSLESWFATALKPGLCLVNTYQLGQSLPNCLNLKIGLTVVTSCFYNTIWGCILHFNTTLICPYFGHNMKLNFALLLKKYICSKA